jgi:hypothetical protein
MLKGKCTMIKNLPVNEEKKTLLLNELVNQAFILAEDHINLIAFTVKQDIKKSNTETVLNTFADYLTSKIFEGFAKEQLLSYISSGFLFEVRSLVEDKLYNHELIKADLAV